MKIFKTKNCIWLISLIIITLVQISKCFVSFGMNKPHYLFHLGDREPLSINIGWGYWSDNETMRMKYKNTKDNLYVNMNIHDGQSLFQEIIQDTKPKINTTIRYQLHHHYWESQIQIRNLQADSITWFHYFAVQNNDYRKVDHQKYSTFAKFIPQYSNLRDKNQISLKCVSVFNNQTFRIFQKKYKTQQQTIVSQQESHNKISPQIKSQIKIFGLTANISQTFGINRISETFRHLIRVYNKKQKITKPLNNSDQKQKKIIQWEKKQIQYISENLWENKSYVVLFIYGTISKKQSSVIYLTNSTNNHNKKFDIQNYKIRQKELQQQYHKNIKQQQMKPFVTHIISNLYGGITYYFGRLYTQNSLLLHKQDYSYTFTPSRLIFPRSFLWDDGFHQNIIIYYNPFLAFDIWINWINKIDIFGWIGREQIRGGQISSMMPDQKFVYQDWFQMNPPTLMLPIISLIQLAKTNKNLEQKLQIGLFNYYHRIEMWYRYFKNTQSHQCLSYKQIINKNDRYYRWHCKDQCSKGNFMGSGLDDYPRRNQSQQIAKQHVDLVSWLYFFSNALGKIGEYLENVQNKKIFDEEVRRYGNHQKIYGKRNVFTKKVKYYQKQSQKYIHKLYESLYDQNDNLFKDVVVINEQIFIQKFVNIIGYINLFPFFTGMQQQNLYNNSKMNHLEQKREKSIKKVLDIMSDEKLLLSKDGLRSLSYSDPLYGTGQNYWRGSVWLNINYLVLRACKLYYWNDTKVGEQIKIFYEQLRGRLIRTVYKNYQRTGYLFENYYENEGHRGFPFYGWTATIVNIITEQY